MCTAARDVSVCLSVCWRDRLSSPITTEPIEMPFEEEAQGTNILDGGIYGAIMRIRLNDPCSAVMLTVATITVATCSTSKTTIANSTCTSCIWHTVSTHENRYT